MPSYGPYDDNAASEVTSGTTIADNRIVRGDGGAKGIQQSGVTLDDSNNASGLGTIGSGAITATGVSNFASGTASPANGSTSARLLLGTTAGFGIYYGTGAPTVSAAQGAIYIRAGSSSAATAIYTNTDGSTTWTAAGGSGGVDGIYTDIASAGSVALGGIATVRGNITGNTTITAFTGGSAGTYKEVKFAGALTLTHNATSLILKGGQDVVTAADDTHGFVTNDGTNWREVWYEKADGAPRNIGTISGGTNPGALVLADMTVTSGSAAATEHSWALRVDGTTVAKVYAESDGSGGIQNPRLEVTGNARITAAPTLASAVATPAAGSTSARVLLGTTAGFGIYYGSGAPTVSAAQGSIYLRSDGSGTADRLYVNTNGTTGWTNFTSAT